ncbi:MAG: efflux RND transporter periplasmic adaptor subunit [Candidatus Tectomicrobia bacterium]|nr:efflux RND transporter periplasmic adaptor subunit [Candidatus Tectomicrobia bacterium]
MLRRALVITISTLVLLAVGIGGMTALVRLRKPPERQSIEERAKLVRVMKVQQQELPLTLEGFGTVRSKTEWRVVPEVAGPLVQVSPYLRAGLHVQKGELLLEIDPRPYQLAVQRIQAQIEQDRREIDVLRQQQRNYEATLRIAKRNLEIAEAELKRDETLVRKGTISSRERDLRRQSRNEMEQGVQTAQNNWLLIDPQIAKTEAAIAVAQVQLADAELQLEKTRLRAPFDGQVISSHLDPGEFVQAGQEAAKLYDTSVVEIPMSIPLDDLRWFPSLSPDVLRDHSQPHPSSPLPPATVHWRSSEREYTWQGHVGRWESGLDARTRTLTLVIEVNEPWKSFRPGDQPPLQPGMFCRLTIETRRVPQAVRIPRTALRPGNTVFLVQDGVLAVRPVEVLYVQKESVIVTAGLEPGDQLIVSPLSTPVVGMKLRSREVDPQTLFTAQAASRADRAAPAPGQER